MAFLLRWWQSLLHALSKGGGKEDGWVEPGNEITRAILTGSLAGLPAFEFVTEELLATSVPGEPRVVEAEQPMVVDVPDVAVDEPAAEQQDEAPAPRTKKRRGRRAA